MNLESHYEIFLIQKIQLTGFMLAISRLERGTALFNTWNVR